MALTFFLMVARVSSFSEVPWEFAVIANPPFLVTFGSLCDVHIHAILRTDMWLGSLFVEQLQKVHLLLARVFAVSLG
jgi:hypothetical protein